MERALYAAVVAQAIEDYAAPGHSDETEENRMTARNFLFPELAENDTIAAEYTRHSDFVYGTLGVQPQEMRAQLAGSDIKALRLRLKTQNRSVIHECIQQEQDDL